MNLQCGKYQLDLSQPRIMGILNVTADSFSDGGAYFRDGRPDLDLALRRAEAMAEEGADIVDVGGESTRPGADPVSLEQERERVLPMVRAISEHLDLPVSVDTSSPEIMREAADAGAAMINDVRALQREGALEAAAAIDVPVCLMHMQGEPGTMQQNPHYEDVLTEVVAFLEERATACEQAGIASGRLVLDPGFGFGKNLDHNLRLLRELPAVGALGHPVLVGMSRKSMLSKLLGRELPERLPGSLAVAMLAAQRGASLIRVHDVAATRDVLQVLAAVEGLR